MAPGPGAARAAAAAGVSSWARYRTFLQRDHCVPMRSARRSCFPQVLHNLGNGLINPSLYCQRSPAPDSDAVRAAGCTLAQAASRGSGTALWLLIFTAVAYLWLALLVNARFHVMPSNRIRYLISLWPLAALAGAVLLRRSARDAGPARAGALAGPVVGAGRAAQSMRKRLSRWNGLPCSRRKSITSIASWTGTCRPVDLLVINP